MMQDKYESVDFFATPLTQFSPVSESQAEENYKNYEMDLEEPRVQNLLGFEFRTDSSKKIPLVDENMLLFSIDESEKELNQVHVNYEATEDFQFSPSGSNSPSFEILPLWLEKEFATVKGKCQDEIYSESKETHGKKCEEFSQETTQNPQLTDLDGEKADEQSTNCDAHNDESLKNKSGKRNHDKECRSNIHEVNTPTQILSIEVSSELEKDTKRSYKKENLDHTRKGDYDSECLSKKSSENSFCKPRPNQVVDVYCHQESNIKRRSRKLKEKKQCEIKTSLRQRKCKPQEAIVQTNSRKRTKLLSSGESSSIENIDLARRRDVVNKTILRVLRRYFSQRFKKNVPETQDSKSNKKDNFFAHVSELAIEMFGTTHPELKTLQFYLATIIDHKYIKAEDIVSSEVSPKELTTFYDCIYKYSHTRLVNLLSVKPLGTIYQYFYTEARDKILETESALIKNKELYSTVMKEFNLVYQGKIDINSLII